MDERLHLCVDVEERQPWRGAHRAEGSQVELTVLPTGRRASEGRSNAGSTSACSLMAASQRRLLKTDQGHFSEGQPANETLARPAAAKQPG